MSYNYTIRPIMTDSRLAWLRHIEAGGTRETFVGRRLAPNHCAKLGWSKYDSARKAPVLTDAGRLMLARKDAPPEKCISAVERAVIEKIRAQGPVAWRLECGNLVGGARWESGQPHEGHLNLPSVKSGECRIELAYALPDLDDK